MQWKIGGAAGEGIMIAGLIMAKALARAGLYIATTSEYPSLIRGGHNTYIINASNEEIDSLKRSVDLLVALNCETVDLHKGELSKGGGIIYDCNDQNFKLGPLQKDGFNLYPVPLLELATKDGGSKLMMNNVALGASWALMGLPFETLSGVIVDVFTSKGQDIINENNRAAKSGFEFILANFKNNQSTSAPYKLSTGTAPQRLVLTGNEAIGLGCLFSDINFAAIYPMTPINGLLSFLANHEGIGKYIYKQPEDEIAGINMAIGASYAGARSLVATSGGGFDLMVEGYSMAAMTEIPLVIIMGTRPGPSTGLATWTGQGDLKFLLSASQGDFLRVVLAPGDPDECFELTKVAFNLADKYQTPIIISVDKFLCESIGTIDKLQLTNCKLQNDRGKMWNGIGDYKRYEKTDDGISPRALPGQTYFVTNSYEHDEIGYSTEEASVIKSMVEKRNRKYALLEKEVPEPVVYGNPDAEITLVGFGSTKLAAKQIARQQNVNYLHLNWINPFPKKKVLEILGKAKRIVDIEGNSTGQLASWIREQTSFEIKEKILKYDGRPIYPEDIIEGLENG